MITHAAALIVPL